MLEVKNGQMYLYGEIGGYFENGISAKEFTDVLRSMNSDLTIYINSDGGDVWEGIAIHSQLKRYEHKVTVVVDSVAASIASVIAMAADDLVMMPHSYLMVHNPWTVAMGYASDFRWTADLLDRIGEDIASIYAKKSGRSDESMRELMDDETWLKASDAVELGLADRIDGAFGEPVETENREVLVASGAFSRRIAAKHGIKRSKLR